MSELSVRDGRASDAAAIATVHVAGWRAAYDGLLPGELLADLSISARATGWLRAIDAGETVLVVEADGDVIGFASVGASRDDDADGAGELIAIYVHPDHWSAGAGHVLHEAALTRIAALGYETITLWVLDGNDRAIGFYRRHGWQPDGSTKLDELGDVTLREQRFRRRV